MEFRELRLLASQREIQAEDLVWNTDDPNKRPAASFIGLIPAQKPTEVPPASDVSDADPYAVPKTRTIADGPPGGLYLPHLQHSSFSLFFGVLVLAIGLGFIAWKVPLEEIRSTVIVFSGLALISWIGLAVVYLHRAWDMMHMFGAPFTGGKAIRFLFVPLFNALWSFVVLHGWAGLWNRSVESHPGLSLARRVWRPTFFIFSVLFLMSQTLIMMHAFTGEWPSDLQDHRHLISLGVQAVTLLFGLACWYQMTTAINFLARKKS